MEIIRNDSSLVWFVTGLANFFNDPVKAGATGSLLNFCFIGFAFVGGLLVGASF